jgi:hypothetical protein
MHKVNPMKEEWGRLQRDNDLEKANEAIDDNRVVQDTFKVASDTYTLAQGYKHTCELMIMKWCNAKCDDAMPSNFSGLSKNAW